jgi:hypothetical protein
MIPWATKLNDYCIFIVFTKWHDVQNLTFGSAFIEHLWTSTLTSRIQAYLAVISLSACRARLDFMSHTRDEEVAAPARGSYAYRLKDFLASSVLWNITPCSPLKVTRSLGGTYRLHLQGERISQIRNQREIKWQAEAIFTLVSSLAYPSTLKMQTKCSSEKSVAFQQTRWHYIHMHNHRYENLKP